MIKEGGNGVPGQRTGALQNKENQEAGTKDFQTKRKERVKKSCSGCDEFSAVGIGQEVFLAGVKSSLDFGAGAN